MTELVEDDHVEAGDPAADRAEKVLRCWTREGEGQAEATPAGKTQADPEVQQELAKLKHAIVQVDRKTLQALGGVGAASRRLLALRKLPEGTPLKANPRGSIDRYTTWSTTRLINPEGAV